MLRMIFEMMNFLWTVRKLQQLESVADRFVQWGSIQQFFFLFNGYFVCHLNFVIFDRTPYIRCNRWINRTSNKIISLITYFFVVKSPQIQLQPITLFAQWPNHVISRCYVSLPLLLGSRTPNCGHNICMGFPCLVGHTLPCRYLPE